MSFAVQLFALLAGALEPLFAHSATAVAVVAATVLVRACSTPWPGPGHARRRPAPDSRPRSPNCAGGTPGTPSGSGAPCWNCTPGRASRRWRGSLRCWSSCPSSS